MNNDTKWEAVEWSQLRVSDRIRARNERGDVLHGEFVEDVSQRSYLRTDFNRHFRFRTFVDHGYTVERAVPERTLPTEPGWYARTLAVDLGLPIKGVYGLDDCGHWYLDEKQIAPPITERLTRLVPVTEVEEAEKRIAKLEERIENVRARAIDGRLALAGDGNRDYLFALLRGSRK